jgi:hypothetical protein
VTARPGIALEQLTDELLARGVPVALIDLDRSIAGTPGIARLEAAARRHPGRLWLGGRLRPDGQRAGGRFCMDAFTRHPDRMKPGTRIVTTSTATTTQMISYNPASQRMIRRTQTRYAGLPDPICTASSVRLYTAGELLAMLSHAGLHVDAQFGGYRGQDLTATSDRIVIIGHKP